MRYTTLIDISEIRTVYKSQNTRLLYLHMALKAGYHDDDRDKLSSSIRILAMEVGLSVSATRHALGLLEREGLIRRNGQEWEVKKWICENPPSPRPKKTAGKTNGKDGGIGARYDKEIEEYQARLNAALRQMTREEVAAWLEELKEGKCIKHHGAYINVNQRNIDWLTNVLKRL